MACKLARYGVPVRIIDKAAHRTDKSKAPVVWSRTLELLDRGGPSALSLMLDSRPRRLTSSPPTRS
jgi:2-polyprenyl-6-methoxyphenol hydroxylase-like FAD-dependent oxidoreductase